MTEEEINVAICRHFGWRFKGDPEFDAYTEGWATPESFAALPSADLSQKHIPNLVSRHSIPKYAADLNAMHEAEKALTPSRCETYEAWLMDFNASGGNPCKYYRWHATARQRAEAFLRTVGKWNS